MTNKKLQSLIEEICNDFGVKYKFIRKKTFAPMFVKRSTREVVVNLSMLKEILLKEKTEVSTGEVEKILRNTIRHESEHLRVFEELEKMEISSSESDRGDYVMAVEAYIENNISTFRALRESIRDIALESAFINPTRAYLKAREDAFEVLTYVLFLSEDEIKAAFEMDCPFFSNLFLVSSDT